MIVDCENARIPGQIRVALGRAVTPENRQVKNFKPHLISEHSQKVKGFTLIFLKPSVQNSVAVELNLFHQSWETNYILFSTQILKS